MSEREADHPSMLSAEEVKAALRELFGNAGLQQGMRTVLPEELVLYIAKAVETVETIADFQEKIILPFLQFVQRQSIEELTVSGLEQLDPSEGYLFISNHRDIVLDSAFLNKTLFENGFETSQIAIGDNLMKHGCTYSTLSLFGSALTIHFPAGERGETLRMDCPAGRSC
jgi:hypothetical protein